MIEKNIELDLKRADPIALVDDQAIATFWQATRQSDQDKWAKLFQASPHLANSLMSLVDYLHKFPHQFLSIDDVLNDAQKALDMVPKNL